MPTQHAIFEFQEHACRIYVWQNQKDALVLKSVLRAPLIKTSYEAGEKDAQANAQVNASTIRQALKDANLKVSEGLALVPKQWVTLRIVTLPSADPAELAEMARFEAERHIPFHVERHVVSHHVLRVESIQGSQVLIAAIDGPPAEEITAALEAAGIHLSGLDVSTVALANALLLGGGRWDPETHPTVCQLDIGCEATDITILHGGIPVFARSITLGIDKVAAELMPGAAPDRLSPRDVRGLDLLRLADSERESGPEPASSGDAPPAGSGGASARQRTWHERLMHEIRQTFDFARRQFECRPLSRIFLSGPGADLGNLEQILRTTLGVEPVKIDPFAAPEAAPSPDRTAEGPVLKIDPEAPDLADAPWTFASAAGAVLRDFRPGAMRIDLLPPRYIQRRLAARRRRSLLTTACLGGALILCLLVFAYRAIGSRKAMLEFYHQETLRNEPRVEEIKYRKTVVKILKEHVSRPDSALSILDTLSGWDELFDDAKMKVALAKFDYNMTKGDMTKGTLRLEGEARGYEEVNDFLDKLAATGFFTKPPSRGEGKWAPARFMRSVNVMSFTIGCDFQGLKTGEAKTEGTEGED